MLPAHGQPRQQHRRQHHDQQRPQVIDQIGLHRRRILQPDKEQKVVAKQAIDTQRQGGQRHPPRRQPEARQRQRNQPAHHQRQAGEQKRRHMAQRHPQAGQAAPHARSRPVPADWRSRVRVMLQGRWSVDGFCHRLMPPSTACWSIALSSSALKLKLIERTCQLGDLRGRAGTDQGAGHAGVAQHPGDGHLRQALAARLRHVVQGAHMPEVGLAQKVGFEGAATGPVDARILRACR